MSKMRPPTPSQTGTPMLSSTASRADAVPRTPSRGGGSGPASPQASSPANAAVRASMETLKIRGHILKNNKELARSHKELVVSGLLTEDEFWTTHKDVVREEQLRRAQGRPSAMLADVRPDKAVGSGGATTYTLTPMIIHSIFMQYPGVRRAYRDFVPERMTEEQFWTKFLQSEFFYRDRARGGAAAKATGQEDMFDKYDREFQEEERKRKRARMSFDTLVDLEASEEDHFEGFGNRPDSTMRGGRVESAAAIADRLHRHANIVLHGEADESAPAHQAPSRESQSEEVMRAVVLEDLEKRTDATVTPLDIRDQSRYMDVQQASSIADTAANGVGEGRARADAALARKQLAGWKPAPLLTQLSTAAAAALLDMLSTSLAFKEEQEAISAAPLLATTAEQIKTFSRTTTQLLRHFWACFRRPELASKEERLANSLRLIAERMEAFSASLLASKEGSPEAIKEALACVKSIREMVDVALRARDEEARRRAATPTRAPRTPAMRAPTPLRNQPASAPASPM